jgi:hypothetical protein
MPESRAIREEEIKFEWEVRPHHFQSKMGIEVNPRLSFTFRCLVLAIWPTLAPTLKSVFASRMNRCWSSSDIPELIANYFLRQCSKLIIQCVLPFLF